ncbi:MAG: HDIG domain-containing protein, partial [Spirochaetaceae bacterium]|nr:HDIG domain-containing protein [Spirochaetaceae bacterium]
IDMEATEKKRNLRHSTLNPQFVMQENITQQVLNRLDDFQEPIKPYLENRGPVPTELLDLIPLSMIESLASQPSPEYILSTTREMVVTIMYRGYFKILDNQKDLWEDDDLIEVITTGEVQGFKTTMIRGYMLTKDNIDQYISSQLPQDLSPPSRALIRQLVLYFIEENCYYNQLLTNQRQQEIFRLVDPVEIQFSKGDILIYQGAVLTSRDIEKLDSLIEQLGPVSLGTFLYPFFYLGLIVFLGACFMLAFKRVIQKPQNIILAFYLLLFFIIFLIFILQWTSLDRTTLILALFPAGLITLLLSQILIYREDLLVFSILLSLLSFFLSHGQSEYFIFTLVSAMAGVFVLPKGERRIDLFKAGARLGLIHFLMILFMLIQQKIPLGKAIIDLGLALVSGPLASLVIMGMLPLFEQFMNSCTPYRLSELSNLNDPIMKRMFIRAPGTYVHSINVAYMAEPACENIGANAMLARVGGYYHDIGKIDQAEYYIENQKEGNKHDELKASLSAAIIKSHVKAGVERARELKLPKEIIDIIAQHHGTSLIRYFYDRAMKDERHKSTINREDFCHPGPRPQTKEAAVVMLADTVEAATRTLRKPTRAKLEKFIWELIIDRFQNGELNDSSLTLKELEIIKDNFVHVLTGHFHSRIDYPAAEIKKNEK